MRRAAACGIPALVLLLARNVPATDSIYVWIGNGSSTTANISLATAANTCLCPNPPVSSSACVGDSKGNPASVAPGDNAYWLTMEPDPTSQCVVVNITTDCTVNGSTSCGFTVVDPLVGPIFDWSCWMDPTFTCLATAKQGDAYDEYVLGLQLYPPLPTPSPTQ